MPGGSWTEVEDESFKRPYNRRRTTPVYDFPRGNAETTTFRQENGYEEVRDPFTALEEAEAKVRRRQEGETTTLSTLKAVLKQQQSGSVSLSEILQQKNLSLADLLRGKQQAISALTEKPPESEAITEYKNPADILVSGSMTAAKPESDRRTYIYKSANNIFSDTRTMEVINEPTTERRIFVPSHPKYYTSFDYQPDFTEVKSADNFIDATTTEKPIITKADAKNKSVEYRLNFMVLKPKLKSRLPLTSAKLNKLMVTKRPEPPPSAIPPKAIQINVKDIFGLTQAKQDGAEKQEGPIKMTIDIESLMKKTTTERAATSHRRYELDLLKIKIQHNKAGNNKSGDSVAGYFAKKPILIEKLKPPSAKEELMEILGDKMGRQSLSRILELRNMTVEELIAQRERGSSQLHLADIFHNRTREPEPPNEPYVGHIDGGGLPFSFFFNRRNPKNLAANGPFASVIDIRPVQTAHSSTSEHKHPVGNFPTYKIEMDKLLKERNTSPYQISILKNLYPNLYDDLTHHPDRGDSNKIDDSEASESSREELKDEDYDFRELIRFPAGVKSAIVASLVIIAISIFLFFTIFVICKWTQKQRHRLCYGRSFPCSRIKSPILPAESKRTIRPMMADTIGGRKQSNSYAYPQSMSDYAWDNDKKIFH